MDMTTFLLAFGLTFLFILALEPAARPLGLLDRPGGRKEHLRITPLIGGPAMFLAVLITLAGLDAYPPALLSYLLAAAMLVVVGALDDRGDLPVRTRLLAQVGAGLILALIGDLVIQDLGDVFGFGPVRLGVLAVPFTVFAVVGLINAFNMLDGLDGLAGSVSLVIAVLLGLWALSVGAPTIATMAFILAFAVLGFLLFNIRFPGRRQARVFMGDSGSMFLGLSFAWIVISLLQPQHGNTPPIVGLWFVAFPVLDTFVIMLRRKLKGRSVFAPDRDHFHHILLRANFGVNQTVLVISLTAGGLAFLGMAGGYFGVDDTALTAIFVAAFLIHHCALNNAWRIMKIIKAPGSLISRD